MSYAKKPSPRSVILPMSPFENTEPKLVGFEDEPFDCSTPIKQITKSDIEEKGGESVSQKSSIPIQSTRQIGIPKSPSSGHKSKQPSTQQKASTFRLRRIQLAQQRKWRDEHVERTMQSMSTDRYRESGDEYSLGTRSKHSNRVGGFGKELLISNIDGLEISISSHLQKAGFDSSLMPSLDRYDLHPDPSIDYGGLEDSDDRSTALDTVSSLNSSHYASDDGLSRAMSRASISSRKSGKFRKHHQESEKKSIPNNFGFEDSVHPPLYVSSVIKKRRSKRTNVSPDDIDIPLSSNATLISNSPNTTEDQIASGYLSNDDVIDNNTLEEQLQVEGRAMKNNVSALSPFNTSISTLDKSDNVLDKTDLVSNILIPQSSKHNDDGNENDIPWHEPNCNSIGSRKETLREVSRERPIKSQIFNKEETMSSPNEESHSLSDAKSLAAMRRKRLKLYLSPPGGGGGGEKSSPLKASPGNYEECKEGSRLSLDDDMIEDNFDVQPCDAKSVQTYTTLQTCMTTEPSSQEQMERILRLKQRKIYNLHHALTCTYPHNIDPDDESYIPCPEVRYCQALCTLIKHVQTCTFVSNEKRNTCSIPGCYGYKKMWNHYRRCVLRTFTGAETKKCRLCHDLWVRGNTNRKDEESKM